MLDYARREDTGYPVQGSGFEMCRCPQGYTGTFCELCESTYRRVTDDRSSSPMGTCVPISDPEETEEPIMVTIEEPTFRIVKVGETVTLVCRGRAQEPAVASYPLNIRLTQILLLAQSWGRN